MPKVLNHIPFVFALLFASAAVVNLTVLATYSSVESPAQMDADALEYYDLSSSIVHGTYELDSRRVLGHVAMLSLFRWATGDSLLALQVIVALFFSLSAPMAYLLALRVTANPMVAAATGLATTFWPPFIAYGITLYSETTALPFFLGFLATLPKGASLAPTSPAPAWRWVLSGALLGICMHIRPMYLLFTPFVPLILWIEDARFRPAFVRLVLVACGCALVVLPWSVYISARTGKPLLLSANGGETIAGGLNPALIESGYETVVAPNGRRTWVGPGKWLPDHATGYLTPQESALPLAQRDQLLKARVVRWILEQPGQALYLEGAKLAYMWGVFPFWNGAVQTLAGNIPILVVLAGGLWAMLRFRSRWRQLVLFWSLPIFVCVVAMISWGSWRFRQPGDIGLLALCSLLAVSYLFPRSLDVSDQQCTSNDPLPMAPQVTPHRNANNRSPALYP